jgi:antitoxin component YwqK of YwqJK toxin-antitoxin module
MNQYFPRLMLDLVIYNMIALILSVAGFMMSSNSLDYAHFMFFLKRVILFVSAGVLIGSPFKTKVNIGGAVCVALGVIFIFLKLFFYYVGGGVGSSVVDGYQYMYHQNGAVMLETPYKNLQRDGIQRGYYEDGRLKSETVYEKGKIVGTPRTYYEDGSLKSESFYENNSIIYSIEYTPDGKLLYKREYDEFGNDIRQYYANGKLKMEWTKRDGMLYEQYEYNEQGDTVLIKRHGRTVFPIK